MPDIPGNSSTSSSIFVGGTFSDLLEVAGDRDWVRVELAFGEKVTISLDGITLNDSYLRVRDSAGNLLAENDDGGGGLDSRLVFTAPTSGVFFIEVAAWNDAGAGTYQLSVNPYTPPPVASYSTVATHLTNGYWGGQSHHFAVSQGGTITYDFNSSTDNDGVTAAGQALAVEALALWSDIIGVTFVPVASGGQITFIDNETGAHADATRSGGISSSATVNVSTQWLTDYGTSLTGYAFQTYVHEIGHALGLGHAGFYNGDGSYATDAIFANDSWSVSIMSYFDQRENNYFATQGFTKEYVVTPMIADIRAMGTLYGLSTTTRTGDTTYGFNNNSGRSEFSAAVGSTMTGYTIFDSGGIDTLDYSGFSSNQRIDLTPESFSNVGGGVGNVSIAFNTIIENAIGGSGNDVLLGNSFNNILTGSGQSDTLTGGGGSDTFRDTTANLNGDTITDFTVNDRIVITDASLSGFSYSLSGDTLTYTGGSLTLTAVSGQIAATALVSGGVQLALLANGTPAVRVSPSGQSGDFNGDGRDDILWRDTNGTVTDWLGTINGGFTSNSAAVLINVPNTWQIAGTGDFNGDGRDDILWRDNNGTITNWLGAANGSFADNSAVLNRNLNLAWTFAGVGDFNGDGRDDILWRDTNGTITNFLGTASGNLVDNWAVLACSVPNTWQIAGTGDFNGDGRDDILWRDTNGTITDWLGTANGGFDSNSAAVLVNVPNTWQIAGTGDFNGDGRDDILWRDTAGTVTDWLGTANGGFASNSAAVLVNVPNTWQIAGTGDFNGDGRDDILWRDTNGTVTDWLGTANGGFASNSAAVLVNVPNTWHISPEHPLL